ncbi:hypothetical protein [Agitococcus lubricus]|uniref:START domain-containing protein n=1 Tax=Agitococcus lubricus TaxID=1077255 RepID=A0A2T5IVD8_9GAMM|nr:hypothetical protein [Agitococcus lubricus]PTQ87852.1 hypothetical protein C8N29_11617 [Agitococcus lubricus]
MPYISKQKKAVILGICLTLSATAWAARDDDDDSTEYLPYNTKNPQEWSLVKNDERHKIKTYSKQEDNYRYRSFKTHTIFDAPLEAVARCEFDVNNMTAWYMNAIESKMLQRVSDTEYYYYFRLKTPFGVPQRDAVVRATVTPYSERTGALIVNYTAAPDYIPIKPGVIRMPSYEMVLRMKPLTPKSVELIMEGYADPGGSGSMPKWLINYAQRRMPYANTLGRHRMIDKCAQSNSPIEFKYKE